MQVHGLPSRFDSTEDLRQTPHVAHPQDVDVILAAESLDEGEVDLQSDVTLELLVRGQDAERHAVRVTVDKEKTLPVSSQIPIKYRVML